MTGFEREDRVQATSDEELLRKYAREGDEEAFAELMRRHSRTSLRAAFAVLGDEGLAEDIVQATFATIARKSASIDIKRSFGSWTYRISVRLAQNELRRRMRRIEREKKAAMSTSLHDDVDTGISSTTIAALHEEIAGLAEKYRAPVILHHLEGRSYEEAAAALGCTAKAFSMRLARAREMLRKHLVKRGVAMSSVGLLACLDQSATGLELQSGFVASATRAIVQGNVPARIANLADHATKMLFWEKARTVAAIGMTVLLLAGLGITAAVVVPSRMVARTGTPVREITFDERDPDRPAPGLRLWWNPQDMTLEGEESYWDAFSSLYKWRVEGEAGHPVSFLGKSMFRDRMFLLRLPDGRLLGLNAKRNEGPPDTTVQHAYAPAELQPAPRSLGPAVALNTNAVKIVATDEQGRYFMVALDSADSPKGRVVIWDLERQVLAADLTNLPIKRSRLKQGRDGFLSIAVAPDARSAVLVDSGGGVLVLDLPACVVRHALALPMPREPQAWNVDLVWEEGRLACRCFGLSRDWRPTFLLDPGSGVILERFDHPVIRCGGTTIHVRGHELEVVKPGQAGRRILLPQDDPGLMALHWRCSPDGRWLTALLPQQERGVQLLVDLQEGRCVSPAPVFGVK